MLIKSRPTLVKFYYYYFLILYRQCTSWMACTADELLPLPPFLSITMSVLKLQIGQMLNLLLYLFYFKYFFSFLITVDIQCYISFRYRTQWLYNLLSDQPTKPYTYLIRYIVITILLTTGIFPILYFKYLWLFCNYQFILLNPFMFFSHTPYICMEHAQYSFLTTQL